MFLDKHGVLNKVPEMKKLVIEIGCGSNKKCQEAIAVDCIDYPCVDIVGDAMEVLKSLGASSVDKITSSHFLEHIHDLNLFLKESCRVLKTDGLFEAVVPHFSNPYYYSDLTHKIPFGLYTFSYLVHDHILRRRVPIYNERLPLRLIYCRLIFASFSKRNIRHWLKKMLQQFFNSATFIKEFYEENLCFILPCYEIHFILKKI